MINICDCIIYDYGELKEEKDFMISKIVEFTANTWQAERGEWEKGRDTKQGKEAEQAVFLYFSKYATSLKYIPYDAIRNDRFEKHAPFDGVVFDEKKVSKEALTGIFKKINDEIAEGKYGRISAGLRSEMLASGVFSVEVKSTKVNDTKRSAANFKSYDNRDEIKNLINAICRDDFFTYPHYTRTGEYTWEMYCNFCKSRNPAFSLLSGAALFEAVKAFELSYMDEFYIRVYMDEIHKKAIILGYIAKNDLMEPPFLKKMPQKGKSEEALYLAKSLNDRKHLKDLIAFIEK